MFSRTTMASSINRPMHSEKAIMVITLSVKPARSSANSVPTSATGSVRPVITVLRQEPRKRNTMAMVSAAPSSRVARTSASELRMPVALSLSTVSLMPSVASVRFSSATVAWMRSLTSTVLAPLIFRMSMVRPARPLTMASVSASASPSLMVAS